MKRTISLLLLLTATAVLAQEKNPVTSVAREILPRQQKNLVAAAEEMPANKFDYKPTEQQMPFGHLILHIVESNNHLCSKIGDVPEIETILVEVPDPEGPFGAKGLGEHVLIPTAPAILNAIRHATGVAVTTVPATPTRVLAAINANKGARS